jgi:hypothetical protein
MRLASLPLLALLLATSLLSACALGLPDSTTAEQQGHALRASERWGYK